MTEPAHNLIEPQHAWRVSLAFWFSLLAAAAVYASVALAPKLLGYVTLRGEYQQNQRELVSLERRVAYLERVEDALENDPAFAAELARIDFDTSPPEDERIAVEPLLSLEAAPAPAKHATASDLPWFTPLLDVLARHRRVRLGFLVVAAMIVLGAFTFLRETDERAEDSRPFPLLQPLRLLLRRYRREDA